MSTADTRPAAYVLVETGMHAGARLELREARTWYTAGGAIDTDYWLADADLVDAKVHLALMDGGVRVRLSEGPALVIGAASVEIGGDAALDAPMLWGGVTFRAVVMPDVPEPVHQVPPPDAGRADAGRATVVKAMSALRGLLKSRRVMASVLATIALVIPAGLAISLIGPIFERQHARELQREAQVAQEDPRVRYAQARAAAQRLGDLIGTQTVSVTALDGKTLAVFGMNVPLARKDAVRSAVSQFEGEYAVRDNIVYQPENAARAVQLVALPEGIDLVQYGAQGYLRGSDGRLYLAGGLLPNGMQVDLIREGEVLLSRGTEHAVIRAADLNH